ncbi:MAG: hypothetical protein ACRCT1_15950 [Microcoleaceae cyanobacterium]
MMKLYLLHEFFIKTMGIHLSGWIEKRDRISGIDTTMMLVFQNSQV